MQTETNLYSISATTEPLLHSLVLTISGQYATGGCVVNVDYDFHKCRQSIVCNPRHPTRRSRAPAWSYRYRRRLRHGPPTRTRGRSTGRLHQLRVNLNFNLKLSLNTRWVQVSASVHVVPARGLRVPPWLRLRLAHASGHRQFRSATGSLVIPISSRRYGDTAAGRTWCYRATATLIA